MQFGIDFYLNYSFANFCRPIKTGHELWPTSFVSVYLNFHWKSDSMYKSFDNGEKETLSQEKVSKEIKILITSIRAIMKKIERDIIWLSNWLKKDVLLNSMINYIYLSGNNAKTFEEKFRRNYRQLLQKWASIYNRRIFSLIFSVFNIQIRS